MTLFYIFIEKMFLRCPGCFDIDHECGLFISGNAYRDSLDQFSVGGRKWSLLVVEHPEIITHEMNRFVMAITLSRFGDRF